MRSKLAMIGLAAGAAVAIAAGSAPAGALPVQQTLYEAPATAPAGGLWLPDGTAAGGHLWVADHVTGLCRVDPTPANPDFPGVLGSLAACYNFGLGRAAGTAGQPAYDPDGGFVYLPDTSSKSRGVTRLSLNTLGARLVTPTVIAPTAGLGGNQPSAVALGPDGKLYVGFRKNGSIVRITNPGGAGQTVEQVGRSSDGQPVRSMAFADDDLYLGESRLLTVVADPAGRSGPGCAPRCVAADAGTATSLLRIDPAAVPRTAAVYAAGFSFASGVAVLPPELDPSGLGGVFVGDDPTDGGLQPLQGRWWAVPYVP